ncbi:MXAN_6640 family putative metalloprotease [Nocardioides sp. URHA0032]|uniref:MXAN_6640 family putative metalloprotease n=1 Tax=Nocardioides sp. URHA0032 TaxID=1380388 RepID=UPI00048B3E89|nr:MXAN_6640 family putative metalloprotease [Nocardioides sp. URHA0032]
MLRRPLAVLVAATLPLLPLVAAPAYAGEPDPVAPVHRLLSSPLAARALAAAEHPDGSRDQTLVLRDLRTHRDELGATDRARADALLQRPGGGQSECFTTVCVHWYSSGPERSTQTYVDKVARTAQSVLKAYAAAGYRAPEPDGSLGGNALLDIYLADLGSQGLYGYCDSDRTPTDPGPYDAPAYCAFDNDYAEFPSHTPLENLQVTAAHELFHAVQFAYDYDEDAWFMEATATWAEDELYDGVNDNLQYLAESPLSQPASSMDHFEDYGVRQYGDWIFFRYLTERYANAEGGLPTIIRDMWGLADGAKGGPNQYSIQAVSGALGDRGTSLRAVWADFADANRRPGTSYDEGRANHYPTGNLGGRVALTGSARDSGWKTRRVDHLAASTVRFSRAPGMRASSLRLSLDLPATTRGSGAVATVYRTSGRPTTGPIRLDAAGNATTSVDFGHGVKYVEVTLANAGTDYDCWRRTDTGYSCRGKPLDDDLPLRVRAKALR